MGGSVTLHVSDDGCGFDLGKVPPDCLGLSIIHERAQAVGAVMEIESEPGHGTDLTVTWDKMKDD
jgi:signal transduction histidine kinase